MPELPEVETVRRVLATQIIGKKIESVEVHWDKIIQYPSVQDFSSNIKNQTILDMQRLGKYLMFVLTDYVLVSHLRMEGKYFIKQTYEKTKHDHIIFKLNNGYLVYNDTRKFGTMHLYHKSEPIACISHIAKDALDMDLATFIENSAKKKSTLKQLLLDQSVIAGIGNIYADEIIYKSKLHPELNVKKINTKDFSRILKNTKIILNKAIEAGGTTIRSYTSSLKVDGRFQLQLAVHMQKKCPKCNSDIKKIKVAQRGTYICPKCQKIN